MFNFQNKPPQYTQTVCSEYLFLTQQNRFLFKDQTRVPEIICLVCNSFILNQLTNPILKNHGFLIAQIQLKMLPVSIPVLNCVPLNIALCYQTAQNSRHIVWFACLFWNNCFSQPARNNHECGGQNSLLINTAYEQLLDRLQLSQVFKTN